ncbi:MAG: hypothetical protein WAL23_07635 [Nitrososphaeraceae archaeon]
MPKSQEKKFVQSCGYCLFDSLAFNANKKFSYGVNATNILSIRIFVIELRYKSMELHAGPEG